MSSTTASASDKKRPIVWMIVAGVAILVAIGFAIWAFKTNSDLNETQADLDAQKAATLQAQSQVKAQTDAANAAAAELEKISSDNEIYVVSNEDVAQAQSDVATAEQAVAEASADVSAAQDQLATLSAEREQARAERDLARAERQQARICSRGSLGALSKLGKGEADAATSELATVESACAASVSG